MPDPILQYRGEITRQLQLPSAMPETQGGAVGADSQFAQMLQQMYPQAGAQNAAPAVEGTGRLAVDGMAAAQTQRMTSFDTAFRTGRPDAEVSPVGRFANALEARVDSVNEVMTSADDQIEAFVSGDDVSVHEVMVHVSKADLNFKLMTTVGRKVIEAYQDVMRMQV